ncbi:hypothetical protein GF325_16455 [Candidatus Bathyarchaeota archaeon]|nr:hypothetical protein [Candidatus Bathyarchaeota archaeon]
MASSLENSIEVVQLLQSGNEEERINAANLIKEADLQGIDVSEFYPILRGLLCNPSYPVRMAAAGALMVQARRKDPVQSRLYGSTLVELQSTDPSVRFGRLEWLQQVATPDLVNDRDERVIEFALPLVSAMFSDGEERVAIQAIRTFRQAISEHQDIEDALPALMYVLRSGSGEVQEQASFAIQAIAMKGYDISGLLKELLALLDSKEEPVKFGVADALAAFFLKRKKWHDFLSLLHHDDKDIRQEAAGTIAHVPVGREPVIIKALQSLIETEDSKDVQMVATRGLLSITSDPNDMMVGIPVLLESLKGTSVEHQVYGSKILKQFTRDVLVILENGRNRKKVENIDNLEKKLESIIQDLQLSMKSITNTKVLDTLSTTIALWLVHVGDLGEFQDLLEGSSEKIQEHVVTILQDGTVRLGEPVLDILEDRDEKLVEKLLKTKDPQTTKTLDLSGQSLDRRYLHAVPASINILDHVEEIDLSHNLLRSIPGSIGTMSRVKKLVISYNRLSELPANLGNLSELVELWASRNAIRALPPELGNLRKLRILHANHNEITAFPRQLGALHDLVLLELKGNRITSLPTTFCHLDSLRSLDLSSNPIKKLPACFGQLSSLENLSMSGVKFTAFPGSILDLPKLKTLSLSNCSLTSIPPAICQLKHLETLDLNGNRISRLPAEIAQLHQLQYISMRKNQLDELPIELRELHSLRWLDVQDNPMEKHGGKASGPNKVALNLERFS